MNGDSVRRSMPRLPQFIRGSAANAVLLAFAALCIVLAGRFGLAAENGETQDQAGVMGEFSIEKDGGPLLLNVPVRFQSGPRSCTMLVATGLTFTCFDQAHSAALGMPRAETRVQGRAAPTFDAPQIQFGSRGIQAIRVACLDLGPISRAMGVDIDGLLGMDYLRALVFSIDFGEGKFCFLHDAPRNCGLRVPLLWDDAVAPRCPMVRAELLPGAQSDAADAAQAESDTRARLQFVLDTGVVSETSGTLTPDETAKLASAGLVRPIPREATLGLRTISVHKTEGVALFTSRGLRVGALRHPYAVFASHPRDEAHPLNSLGLGYLSRYCVVFDFPNDSVYLRPRDPFPDYDAVVNLAGFEVRRSGGNTVVTAVLNDYEAAAAGLKLRDQIVAVDGQDTRSLSLFGVHHPFHRPGRHTVVVRRDGREQSVVLDLKLLRDGSEARAARSVKAAERR